MSAWPIPMMSYNMCENLCPSNVATSESILDWMVAADQPWSIGLQEMCTGTLSSLLNRLSQHGLTYSGIYVTTYTNAAHCPGGMFGDAILYAGSGISNYWYQFSQPSANCSTQECRKMACQSMNTIDGPVAACNTHTAPGPFSTTQTDATEYAFVTQLFNGGQNYLWAGGDLNLQASQLPTNYWNAFTLASDGPTYSSWSPTITIDWIWIKYTSQNAAGATPICSSSPPASDHCLIYGFYTPY
jgi:hypothetical protein